MTGKSVGVGKSSSAAGPAPTGGVPLKAVFSKFHVAVAAEAIAAAQFARCGLDVSIQYGANQPQYDLLVRGGEAGLTMAVSVKGSKDGSWGLTQGFLKNGDYHGAINKWLEKHKPGTIFCFVQFKGRLGLESMPGCYLATPAEVATMLKSVANGKGGTILYESHTWTKRAVAAGTTEQIPASWTFTESRALELLQLVNAG